MKGKVRKVIVFILMAAFALIIGEILGDLCKNIEFLAWVSKNLSFKISPAKINFKIFAIVFGFSFHINIAQIILCALMVLIYPKIAKWFKL